MERQNLRNEYLKARVAYSKAVKRAKRAHQRSRCEQLERDLECPKKFWGALKKMNVSKVKKARSNLLQVFDEGGPVKSGEESLTAWQSHFVKVLGGDDKEGQETSCMQVNTEDNGLECSQHLCELISREEVLWALNEVKKNAAPGSDGIEMDMLLTERLFDVCWEHGIVPSLWRESIVVPVPKKQTRGVCDVNTFRGISLTSLVSKVLCKILENRLSCIAEEKGLIAEEQGGFRKGRGCRDQLLSLVLLVKQRW